MFQHPDPETRKRRLRITIIAVVAVVFITIGITLLAVLLHKKDPLQNKEPPRIECPGFKDKEDCIKNGCEFDPVEIGPSCYLRATDFGYVLTDQGTKQSGLTATLSSKSEKIPYGNAISKVTVDVDYITENILRVKFVDSSAKRYEVPVQKKFSLLQNRPTVDVNKLSYRVELSGTQETFSYKVLRKDGTVLWDSSIGGFMMSNQFLQMASYLPSEYIFGLGEHTREHLKHDMNYKTWPMFSRDRLPERGPQNLYGVHPFYTCLENSGKSHGVLFLNSNAMEVTLMPAPAISFRTIGGVLDFFYFVGDNPEHVVQLYTSLIGRPIMPPYWGLGFQLSRYGYDSLNNVTKAVERTRDALIPQDVQFLDIDYMVVNKDFTYDKQNFAGLPEYIKETQEKYGLKWIIIIDPAIAAEKDYKPYEDGLKDNVFIKRPSWWSKELFPTKLQDPNVTYGKVWPREPVAFPDFFLDKTTDWWVKQFVDFHEVLPFDGLWIDMNEPSNFGTNGEDYEFCEWTNVPRNECWVLICPPTGYDGDLIYNPLERTKLSPKLSSKTLCMESRQGTDKEPYSHYDVHSLYAWSQSIATLAAAEKSTGTRSIVISRATYPSSGRYCGHWLGDNRSIWSDLHDSVIGIQEFNLFGIPYIGADVCGFSDETTAELCSRWMQLGAFYPFYRNHNMKGQSDQDPAILGDEVTYVSRKAVQRRYTLLPYLYTLFYRAHVDGNTVIRPVFHEFTADKTTWLIDEQFMWGSCFLISPVLEEKQIQIALYLPKGEWWEFDYENSTLEAATGKHMLKTATNTIPMHVRGGCIVPTEDIQMRTPSKDEVRNITLYIYPSQYKASGELFIDDGISKDTIEENNYDLYQYKLQDCDLEIVKKENTLYKGKQPILKKLIIFKSPTVSSVTIDSKEATFDNKKDTEVTTITVNKEMRTVKKISWRKDGICPK